MKVILTAAIALSALVVGTAAQASWFPPHVDAITSCGELKTVFVTDAKGHIAKHDLSNSSKAELKAIVDGSNSVIYTQGICGQ